MHLKNGIKRSAGKTEYQVSLRHLLAMYQSRVMLVRPKSRDYDYEYVKPERRFVYMNDIARTMNPAAFGPIAVRDTGWDAYEIVVGQAQLEALDWASRHSLISEGAWDALVTVIEITQECGTTEVTEAIVPGVRTN